MAGLRAAISAPGVSRMVCTNWTGLRAGSSWMRKSASASLTTNGWLSVSITSSIRITLRTRMRRWARGMHAWTWRLWITMAAPACFAYGGPHPVFPSRSELVACGETLSGLPVFRRTACFFGRLRRSQRPATEECPCPVLYFPGLHRVISISEMQPTAGRPCLRVSLGAAIWLASWQLFCWRRQLRRTRRTGIGPRGTYLNRARDRVVSGSSLWRERR